MHYHKVYAWHQLLCPASCYSSRFITREVTEIYGLDLQTVFNNLSTACLRVVRTCDKFCGLYCVRNCEGVELAVCLISTFSWTPCCFTCRPRCHWIYSIGRWCLLFTGIWRHITVWFVPDVSRKRSGHIYGSNIQFMGRLTATTAESCPTRTMTTAAKP